MHTHASINRIYRLVWSAVFQTWVVASELARGRGKSSATPLLSAALVAGLLSLSDGAGAAPQGGQLVGGSGSISANGSTTTINQASDKLSINWQSFNVAKSETVNFVQPSASALAVNRILDTQGSQILGKINANGQVWLINPNGVIFGKDAQINVGGLLASTLNPDDASIGSARSNFTGSSTAGVVNLGSINAAQGGYVALLGHSVSNQGSISAPGGTVALGAGSAVSLNFAGSKLLGLEVTSNQINALAENGGLIQADGGQVLLSAGARDSLLASVVNNTGVIQARTVQEQDGKIILLGGMAAGTTTVGGTLDASAPQGGNGGFIETSAHTVNVDDSANITTASAQGLQGQWLLDPYDFYVKSSGGNITGTALGIALNKNNVTIKTVLSGNPQVTNCSTPCTTNGPYTGTLGDIYINDAFSWKENYTLTLNAYNNIYINSAITATGAAGKLALLYGQASLTGGSSKYEINAPITLQAAVATSNSGNFSTKLGTAVTTNTASPNYRNYYTVITSVGSEGDERNANASNSLQGLGYSTRLSGNYVLGSDIDASGTSSWNSGSGFSPIGTSASSNFTGTFDGLGHTISGLEINRPTTNFVGLFGYLASKRGVKNVGLTLGRVVGASNVGALVGFNNGAISNSYSTGSVSAATSESVTSISSVGGLVGSNVGTISNSYNTGSVTLRGGSSAVYGGGLVGVNHGAVSSSYATGSVGGYGIVIGGLVGINAASGTVSNSYATGAVSGKDTIGGLVGAVQRLVSSSGVASSGTVISSYATGAVTGSGTSGGLAGSSSGGISNSYATGAVRGTITGGLVGSQGAYGTIGSSYATGSVAGTSYAGGLVGTSASMVSGSYASGAVSASSTVSSAGGLMGALFNGGTIANSYATGAVAGGADRGGLVGRITALGYSVSNSYATGKVTTSGAKYAGGLVGIVTAASTGSVTSSFWNSENTSAAGYGSAGKGLGSADMKKASTFSDWSIASSGGSSNIWRIYDGSTTPLLRSFLTSLSTDTTTTYNGAVQSGIGAGQPNIFGAAAASGKNAGTYTGGALYSNQQGYDLSGTGALTIAKKALTTSLAAQTKTYDGSNTATWTSGTIKANGFVNGEDASVTKTSGTYNSKNVVGASSVTATLASTDFSFTGGALASNYVLPTRVSASASISKAALTYTADAATLSTGAAPRDLSGKVSGFVNNETQEEATTGTLKWSTPATNASNAGRYAINGSGLNAANYRFSQAEKNRTALTLTQAVSRVPVMGNITFKAPGTQTTQAINTLPPTGAGQTPSDGNESVQDVVSTPIQTIGKSGLIFMQADKVNLPNGYTQTASAD